MNNEFVLLKKMLPEFVVPQFEIYIQPTMAFVIRVFAWLLPNNHPLYLEHDKSMDNILISDLINLLSDYSLCAGVNCFGSNNITPHVIQKAFNIVDTSPAQQITYYRPHTCTLIINSSVNDSPCSNQRASSSNNNNLTSPPSPKLCYKSFKDLCERYNEKDGTGFLILPSQRRL